METAVEANEVVPGAIELDQEVQQYLTFTVMEEEYGVDIMNVLEIKGYSEATRIPNSPEYIRGVINLRGSIIPIFDLRTRFTGEITDANELHVFIILAVQERHIGILVDTVSDILTVKESEVKPPPNVENTAKADFIDGLISLEDRMVVLLNVDHIFESKDIEIAENHITE